MGTISFRRKDLSGFFDKAIQHARWGGAILLAAVAATGVTVSGEVVSGEGDAVEPVANASPTELESVIDQLVSQLASGRQGERDDAERQLQELVTSSTEGATPDLGYFLSLLPNPTDEMPAEMRGRLLRVRRQIESRYAREVGKATRVSLERGERSLAAVLRAIEEQTGNKIVDRREEVAASFDTIEIDLGFDDEAFWPALDRVLDKAGLTVYNFAGSEAIALMSRSPSETVRYERGTYSGPFRLEVFEVGGRRSLRSEQENQLRLELEISWEPRLLPIAISQSISDIEVFDDQGNAVALRSPRATLSVEAIPGNQATEMSIPLTLPDRSVERLASVRGKLRALVPGRRGLFQFENIEAGKPTRQRQGEAEVLLTGIRRSGEIVEIQMRLRLDDASGALESHRGWVFHNRSYLRTEQGEEIEDIGLETAFQSANEVGLIYLFPVGPDAKNVTWVYEAPTSILNLPVEYELTDIVLP